MASAPLALPRIRVELQSHPAVERALGDADVLSVRGLLHWLRGRSDETRAAIEAALAIDRTHLLASLIAEDLGIPISLEDARKIAAAAPEDWRALMLLASWLEPGAERDAAQQRACQHGADARAHSVCRVSPGAASRWRPGPGSRRW